MNELTIPNDGTNGGDRRSRSLHATVGRLGAIGTALLLVTFLVMSVSRAAFTSSTDNASNSVSTGSILLTDNDSGSSMFNATGLLPLVPVVNCIQVDYAGSLDPTAVALYATAPPTGLLDTYLTLKIEIGPANADLFGTCTSFAPTSTLYNASLESFATTHSSYGTGLSTWNPAAGSEGRAFRFTVTVQDISAAAGTTTSFGFTWETRSS